VAAGVTLPAILGLGWVLDRLPLKPTLVTLYALGAACVLGLGVCETVAGAVACMIGAAVCAGAVLAPMSMWISREAGHHRQSSAFALQKVLAAVYLAAAGLIYGWLQPTLGIRGVFLTCSALCVPLLIALVWLPEPAPSPVDAPRS
jgi:MFS family permease